jgi:hypothetical protein
MRYILILRIIAVNGAASEDGDVSPKHVVLKQRKKNVAF